MEHKLEKITPVNLRWFVVYMVICTFAESIAVAENSQLMCSASDLEYLKSCPQTCYTTCKNTEFSAASVETSQACLDVMIAAKAGDPDSENCASNKLQSTFSIPNNWHDQVFEACASKSSSFKSKIPIKNPIPKCAGSLINLKCRIGKISEETAVFGELVKKFEPLASSENMCDIKNEDLEYAYQSTLEFSKPLSILSAALEKERICQSEVKDWVKSQKCDPSDAKCTLDVRIGNSMKRMEEQLRPSILQATKIPTILRSANNTKNGIKEIYGLYTFMCAD